jgi:PfaD family protein
MAVLPALGAEALGDPAFLHCHGVRYPYMAGAMANGIGSADIVIAMGKAGMLGSFGAAGLSVDRIEQNIDRIQRELDHGEPYCVNLIHSPNEPRIEQRVMELLLRKGVRLIEASAYLGLTPMLVQYRLSGLERDSEGFVVARQRMIAKISRSETARAFMQPAPEAMVQALVAEGKITAQEADLSREISMADDVTVEADSGGHTDNRPLVALLPLIISLRDRLQTRGSGGYAVRVGAAGGISSPSSTAAAFSMGAAYVLTGSINQAASESGVSPKARALLATAEMADVMMAPAADMFEMGVKVQVLKRGTMFAMRAQKLYELYRQYDALRDIPQKEMERLEQQLFRRSIDDVWAETQSYWQKMDARQLERAAQNPKHKMALCFRWYLGLASRWAIQGDESRAVDYQVWCGPAMGAFNDWVKGSVLEPVANRSVVQMAHNLLAGAVTLLRAQQLRTQGVPVPDEAFHFSPRAFAAQ